MSARQNKIENVDQASNALMARERPVVLKRGVSVEIEMASLNRAPAYRPGSGVEA
jgi:hypothetical protein